MYNIDYKIRIVICQLEMMKKLHALLKQGLPGDLQISTISISLHKKHTWQAI